MNRVENQEQRRSRWTKWYNRILAAIYTCFGLYFLLFDHLISVALNSTLPIWTYRIFGVILILYAGIRVRNTFKKDSLKDKSLLLWMVIGSTLLGGCSPKGSDKNSDTITTGVIPVAIDESFAPILQQQINVFESVYPMAGIVASYVDENEAIRRLLADSVRLAVVTRRLTEQERLSLQSRKFYPKEIKLATDALALIVNRQNPDSLISLMELRAILQGELKEWQQLKGRQSRGRIQLVFDNPNSSAVRFAIDSVCGGKPLDQSLFAQRENADVISYVAKNRNAIGVIGVSWVGDRRDSTLLEFIDNVRVMSVSREPECKPSNSYKPYQAYVALGDYPLCREVVGILNDPRGALPTGFYSFLASDRGQRIFLKSGMVPATQPVRILQVND